MSNVVLAFLNKTETAHAVLSGAERLSQLLGGAAIEALVARIPPLSTILPTEEIMSKETEEKMRAEEQQRAAALHRIYENWTKRRAADIESRWIDHEERPETVLSSWGGRADYIVISRPEAHADNAEHSALHAALFDTDRPVLIMPPQWRSDFGERVAIAWRDDKFSLRALLAALRCIPREAQVHVLMGHREGDPAPKIPRALQEHGISVTPHELRIGEDVFGAQLLAQAHELQADLLVMGAFVHSAWHNLLFGGVTKYILSHDADIPVLMRH